jgi:hypothetical protein
MRALLISLALLVCSSGCFLFFGDKVATVKGTSVSLRSKPPKEPLAASAPEVQEAVGMIAHVVVPYGLLRDTNTASDKGVVATFHDEFRHSGCTVHVSGDTLTASLFEYGHGSASQQFKEMSSQVRKVLRRRYGFPRKD